MAIQSSAFGVAHQPFHQIWQLPGGCEALVKEYSTATLLLNDALASPTESKEDATLLATLLFVDLAQNASSQVLDVPQFYDVRP